MTRALKALRRVALLTILSLTLAGCGRAAPKPVVLMNTIRERRSYSPVGVALSSSVGVTVRNDGSAGDVLVRAAIQGARTAHTLVLPMEPGERVTVWARFGPGAGVRVVEWSARAAKRGDKTSGSLSVERAP